MKKLNLLLIALVLGISVNAQDFNDYLEVSREVLKTEKKALIADLMQFSSEESQAFWPLYNEYEDAKYKVNTRYFNLVQKFADNFENMTDEVATEVINESISVKQELVKLEKSYAKKFMKILTPKRTIKYLQAENKIKALIDAEMALEIPFLDEIEDWVFQRFFCEGSPIRVCLFLLRTFLTYISEKQSKSIEKHIILLYKISPFFKCQG
jgi:hypothetical protein